MNEERKTIRIPVVVNEMGEHVALSASDADLFGSVDDESLMDECLGFLSGAKRAFWVEVSLPLPDPSRLAETVKDGEVVDAGRPTEGE